MTATSYRWDVRSYFFGCLAWLKGCRRTSANSLVDKSRVGCGIQQALTGRMECSSPRRGDRDSISSKDNLLQLLSSPMHFRMGGCGAHCSYISERQMFFMAFAGRILLGIRAGEGGITGCDFGQTSPSRPLSRVFRAPAWSRAIIFLEQPIGLLGGSVSSRKQRNHGHIPLLVNSQRHRLSALAA